MATPSSSQPTRVVTLEHLILDTFTRVDEDGVETPVEQPDQIGGGGTYTIIGARMFLPPSRLGMVVDYTPSTLPEEIKDQLKSYGEELWAFRERQDGHPTARAVNRYKGQTRGFEYLTRPLLLTPSLLEGTPFHDPLPSTIHFISYPAPRAEKVLSEVRKVEGWTPRIVWEPEDETLEDLRQVAGEVDIIAPNHNEALRLFSLIAPPSFTDDDVKSTLTRVCRQLAYLRPRIGAIIRAGHLGCCYASTETEGYRPDVKWIPAYWHEGRDGWKGKVVDPTGAGNAFMGALGAALDEGKSLDEAVRWGSVAASFTIEQNGLPKLTKGEDGKELWNGESPLDRLKKFDV
ncbi:hypothetical protein CI109_102932 [Kwoniella shandongensis]|uniref:Uncharacterized protein n=1 Tax=Kwoniella shandongensis TaxID=1734106 RepID=A0A5M6C9M0_9TREE|nr:uncharacterized protein CI109_000120 [Kwoniella shandongensis]KAA5531280.1 hypothetical protein CI109_000120 [Kwoniella shandongensis]